MKTIKILDIIKKTNAMSRMTGELVFDFVKSEIEKGEKISLSFSGLENCTTSFIGGSVGKLYNFFKKKLDESLKIIDVEHSFWQELIDEQILFATNPEIARKNQEALELVLEL